MEIKAVACFCGAREGKKPVYRAQARLLGEALAKKSLTLIYGGGAGGMMGTVADAVLAGNGQVFGVIPHGLDGREVAHPRLTALHKVDTMHERKALMESLAQAFIALPGGFGTLDELFEIATWSQIGLHEKPIGLLNTENYWAGVQAQIAKGVDEGFIEPKLANLLVIDSDPEALLEKLLTHVPPPPAIQWIKKKA